MTKLIYGIALALTLGTTCALAQPNQDHTCQGGHNCNEGGGSVSLEQGQDQSQYQGQQQIGVNTNENSIETNASGMGVASSTSDSNSVSHARSGDVRSSIDISGGQSESSSASSVGNVRASGGTATGGDSRTSVAILDYEEHSAASAAAVYTQVCQNGGSGQLKGGGFSINNTDIVCEHLRMATVMKEAYLWEMRNGSASCTGLEQLTEDVYYEMCIPDKAMGYLDAYHEHLGKALDSMDNVEEVGLMDKMAGYMVRPLAVLGALVWLL